MTHSLQNLAKFLPPTPPPSFAKAGDIVLGALSSLRMSERIDVNQWATRDRRIVTTGYSGQWRSDFAPYMNEPSSMVTSRRYKGIVFAGPARTAKSESLIINPIGHGIAVNPREILVVCQTQDSAKKFSTKKLDPLLNANKKLRELQLKTRSADNIFEKKFRGNANISIGWPVIGNFSQNEYVLVLLTDYDRFPDDIDGEGNGFYLAFKRVEAAGSLGMAIAESSPGKLIEVDDWEPSTLHEAPPCGGILAEFNTGTRGRFYWTCPHCGDPFRPEWARMHWEEKSTPAASAKTAVITCDNGCVIGPDYKNELNKSGQWLHETEDGQSVVPIDDSTVRETDIYSAACEGPIAALQSWSNLVLRQLNAEEQFRKTGDETALKATTNLDQGRAYKPRVLEVGDGLSFDALKAITKPFKMKVAPKETCFINVVVDVQKRAFVVQVDAYGVGLERWLIDRFEITMPPDEENKDRAIDPARHAADWQALTELLLKPYPVEGSEYGLLPRALMVDTGGEKGVTRNAYAYLRWSRKNGYGHRVYVLKGLGGNDRDRAKYVEPEKVLGKKTKRGTDIRIVQVGTDPLKDELVLSLTQKEAGPNAYHLSEDLSDQVLHEFCAEARTEKGWVKRKSGIRNEAFDLGCYSKALAIILKAEAIDWEKPLPAWALTDSTNTYAVLDNSAKPVEQSEPSAPVKKTRRRKRSSKGYSIHG